MTHFSIPQTVLLVPEKNGTFTNMSEGLGLVTELRFKKENKNKNKKIYMYIHTYVKEAKNKNVFLGYIVPNPMSG